MSLPSISLLAVGDVALDAKATDNPLRLLSDLRKGPGVTFANLETVLSLHDGDATAKAVVLRTHPDRARWLVEAGVGVVSLANNHTLDFGRRGFEETVAVLSACGIVSTGCRAGRGSPTGSVIDAGGFRIGFLAYSESASAGTDPRNDCICGLDEEAVHSDVRSLTGVCDAVVVSIHCGVENTRYPSPWQIRLYRSLVDAGATVVLGHHPHVPQGVERRGGGLIAYSLGNFQFRPSQPRQKESFALEVRLSRHAVLDYRLVPVSIDDEGVPQSMDPVSAERFIAEVRRISAPIEEDRVTDGLWYRHIAGPYLRDNMRAWGVRMRRHGPRHALQCARWSVSPFVLRCYLGLAGTLWSRCDQDLP